MSLTFDERFHVALRNASAKCTRDAAARRAAAKRAVEEFEFSESGRDPRFLPGWFLIPGFAIAAVAAVLLFTLA